jgi:membrane fusion protein, heavy metal efflux system
MTEQRRLHVTPGAAAAAVLVVLMIGAGGTYLLMRNTRVPADGSVDSPPRTATNQAARPVRAGSPGAQDTSPTRRADVVITLSQSAADRAGIEVTPVSTATASDSLRVPGVVEPNAYRQVVVTSLVGGRVVRVTAQLGDRVRNGQPIAQVYSPELAEARTKYVAARAMLEAHDRELQRTQKLVEIGAASRQALERIHAEHAAQTAEVESARARLQLLGAESDGSSSSNPQENATTNVPAPIDGVVTERLANPGLNIDPTTKLFTIVDLSNVWIVSDVYERDLRRVREGARATVSTTANPAQPLEGRVSFIDPQLNTTTRTAKVRVELANPRGELRLGMYTDVAIESAGTTSVLVIPRDAVQTVGDSQVVYVSSADDRIKFIEREVRLGRTAGSEVEVLAGLSGGDSVVSRGSFFVRAEAERLGLRGPVPSSSAGAPAPPAMATSADVQAARIAVTEKGFEPEKVSLRAGALARLTFVRTTDKTCGTEVVFPSLNIKRALPLKEAVVIEFTPSKTGEVAFACGMNMLKGVVVVQ